MKLILQLFVHAAPLKLAKQLPLKDMTVVSEHAFGVDGMQKLYIELPERISTALEQIAASRSWTLERVVTESIWILLESKQLYCHWIAEKGMSLEDVAYLEADDHEAIARRLEIYLPLEIRVVLIHRANLFASTVKVLVRQFLALTAEQPEILDAVVERKHSSLID